MIYDMIYLTAIGLTPGGSSTEHIYTQTIYRTTQFTNQEECVPCPVFARYTLAFALQLRKKHGKTLVRVAGECQLARWKQNIRSTAALWQGELQTAMFSRIAVFLILHARAISKRTFVNWLHMEFSAKLCELSLWLAVEHIYTRTHRPIGLRPTCTEERPHIFSKSYLQSITFNSREMNSYSTTNKMHLFLKLFNLVKRSFRPSSGAPDDGRKDRPKHAQRFTRINNLRDRCILLVVL